MTELKEGLVDKEKEELRSQLVALQYQQAISNETWFRDQHLSLLSQLLQQVNRLNEQLSLVSQRILEGNKLKAESMGLAVESNEPKISY